MKKFKGYLLTVIISVLSFQFLYGQNSDRYMLYGVHEDVVYPYMANEYEKIAKELVDNINKYKVQELKWITTNTNDFRYLYVYPLENMADLDKNNWKKLSEKMGEGKLGELFDKMDKCYSEHFDYTLRLDKDLTYMPGGITQTPQGQNYRRFYYIYFTPEQENKLVESLKAVKKMYQDKGSKEEYRIYRSGFGAHGDFFLVAIAAKDALSYETASSENDKLFGNDAQKVFGEMMKHVSEFKEKSGRMRPDMEPSVK
ncbi:MAG TPA: hypothetical protein PKC72_06130 [Chitinophagaceae bacterium]|nr:hypothetical protein [Chitinophagaceae bacterium]